MTSSSAASPAATNNTPNLTVRRKRERQSFDPAVLEQILAEGLIAHVAMVRDGMPIVLPYLYGTGDLGDGRGTQLLLHGSTGGGLFLDAGTEGVPVSVGITHLDGLVYARSLHDSSANYRSAMIYGCAQPVPLDLRRRALWIVGEHLMPGRRAEVREMTEREVAATQVLAVPLDHVSVKVRCAGTGETADDGEDHGVWAGVLPLSTCAGEPIVSGLSDADAAVPPSVAGLVRTLDGRAGASRAAQVAGSL
ncbi:pyridoxamine 5'-phosphate oxidase family protein [Microbacterium sp. STN6]|uniref:pyridoxamine 5'-phosphate oxidase family protein n=1 Tax=Microbacterium sp. STN6 TaxID=2995588 RepID=UPI002260FF51|nr:pyridoxamine 5'-phosphate oxidase family protein [Microbacterium sp. STN6]MCX7522902.1 pyridoxamine 5'-phosphate oxidase family protein [Microbacterium sp. STN6]